MEISRHEMKDNFASGGMDRKYIFGEIANVPRVSARSSTTEMEERLCETHMTPPRELLSIFFSYQGEDFFSLLLGGL